MKFIKSENKVIEDKRLFVNIIIYITIYVIFVPILGFIFGGK